MVSPSYYAYCERIQHRDELLRERPALSPKDVLDAALRSMYYDKIHTSIKERLSVKADRFKAENGYAPPYWELVKLARMAKGEVDKGK